MVKFIGKRILISVLLVFIVSVLVFALMHSIPGDPVRLAMGYEASEEDVERMREKLNMDKPVTEQYFMWVEGILRGDFGPSIVFNRTVGDMLLERLPRTVSIGLPALMLSIIAGIIFGIISALRRGKAIDQAITFLSTLGVGTPVFWVGIVCIYVFAVWLKLLPIQGYTAPSHDFVKYLRQAAMPVFCLSIGLVASLARQTRSNMLEVINNDYIRTARANGIKERSVIFRHALKNAMIPVVTIIGMQVRLVIGGSLIVEQVFNISGVGMMLTSAISNRDYWVVQGCVLMISLFTVTCNLVVDVLYGFIDPRIRRSRS